MGADRQHGRFGPAEMIEYAGILLPPSQVLSTLLFWLVLLFFVAFGLETLGVVAIDTTIDPVLAYLPHFIGATLIVLLGLLLARFLGAVVRSASAAAGFPNASRVGFLIQVLMGGLVVVLAAQRLGLAVAVLIAPFTALPAASGFAAGLAFALGARPIITHILAGHFLRQSLLCDAFVEIGGERGIVDHVGPTDTLLRSDKKTWSIPNARFLDEIVVQ